MDYPSHLENAWEEEETMPMYRQQRNGWSIVMCQKHCKRETRWSEKNYINNTIQNSLEENNTKPFLKYTKAKKKKKTKKKKTTLECLCQVWNQMGREELHQQHNTGQPGRKQHKALLEVLQGKKTRQHWCFTTERWGLTEQWWCHKW